MKKELRIGIMAEVVYIILNHFFTAPDLFLGLLEGVAICFIIIGIIPEKSYLKLKEWKHSMIKSV